jgi:hypothetical protein
MVHCKKKVSDFLVPSRDVTLQTIPLPGREYFSLFPARKSLVSDNPPGTGKSLIFFYSVPSFLNRCVVKQYPAVEISIVYI